MCLECQNKITTPIHRCPVCGRNSTLGKVHEECRSAGMALSGLLVATEYKNPAIKNLIWHLKYNSVKDISQTLAMVMADFLIKSELLEIKRLYGDKRRTEIGVSEATEFEDEDLIPDEETLVSITHTGYVKRSDPKQFRSQHRGGKGIRGVARQKN